jgi:hypothetical protein
MTFGAGRRAALAADAVRDVDLRVLSAGLLREYGARRRGCPLVPAQARLPIDIQAYRRQQDRTVESEEDQPIGNRHEDHPIRSQPKAPRRCGRESGERTIC